MACICFSDEATFEIGIDTTPAQIRRKKGHVYKSKYLKPTFKSGCSLVGVWGAISLYHKSELVIVPRGQRMNSRRYISLVLKEAAFDFYQKVFEEQGYAVWQEDGARYISKLTREYQEGLKMMILEWPAQSPDLNPIENLWRIMKLRISKYRHRIHSIAEMEDILRAEWDKLTSADWRSCVASLPRRCQECYSNKGGSTYY